MQHFFLRFVLQPLTFYDLLKARFTVAAAAYFEHGVMRAAPGAALMTREFILTAAAAANSINFQAVFFVNFKLADVDAKTFFVAFGFRQTFALGFGRAAFGRTAGVQIVYFAAILRFAALFFRICFAATHFL